MYNFSNRTKFGIKNDTERYLWVGWLVFVILSSLLGDSLILIASTKYKAFKLHKLTVTFIQHIAVSDLLNTIGNVVPAMLSAIYNTGSPNRLIDYVRFSILYYTEATNSLFISTLALGKLLLLKYPLKLRPVSKRFISKLCAGIWVICISLPMLHLGIDKDDVIFDYRIYFCSYGYTYAIWKILQPVCSLLFIIAPVVTVVISTVLILREARKAVSRTKENLRWQGVTTVVLTATVHLTAVFPIGIYFMAESFVGKNPDEPGLFHVEYFRFAAGILKLQILANFFIYSLTVTSFRRFLITKFYEIFSVYSKKSSQGRTYN